MTPQEAAEQYAIKHDHHARYDKGAFLAGQQWQSEQDNQALSSALKEIAELHAKVKELQEDVTLLNKEQVEAIIKLLNSYTKAHGYDGEEVIWKYDLKDIEDDLLSLKKMEPPMMGMSY